MATPIKPLADRIVAVKQEAKNKTASGLFLPDSAKEKSAIAEVKAVGADVKEVKIGDKIIYKEYSTTEVKIDGTEYLLVREEDVLAKIA
ncbi:MAG: co-chaperone GroES [Candidatus Woesebacteria bacterium]|jgi:chaperonin GroES